MIRKKVQDLCQEDVIGCNIYSRLTGEMLIPFGSNFTPENIKKIKVNNRIDAPVLTDSDKKDTIKSDKDIRDAILGDANFIQFKEGFWSLVDRTRDAFNHVLSDNVSRQEKTNTVEELCRSSLSFAKNAINNQEKLILWLNEIDNFGEIHDFIEVHSVKCAVLAGALAVHMKLSDDVVETAVSGAILKDIGMMQCPEKLLYKSSKLTPSEKCEIQKHPVYSFAVLKDLDLGDEIKHIAIEHHECSRTEGYPWGSPPQDVHEYSMIHRLVDIYAAATSQRPYRARKNPVQALKELENEVFEGAYAEVGIAIADFIQDSLVGSKVYLADGREAEIAYFFKYYEEKKPIVKTHELELLDLNECGSLDVFSFVG